MSSLCISLGKVGYLLVTADQWFAEGLSEDLV